MLVACMNFEIIKTLMNLPVARKLAVRNTSVVCLTASFQATGGFVQLFHKIPQFFHDYSGFFQIQLFFHTLEKKST